MHQYALYYLLAINSVIFLLYGMDKYKAKKNNRRQAESNIKLTLNIAEAQRRKTIVKWRISEATLLTMASIGGSLGAWTGMRIWHHMTMHKKFKYGIPLIIILHLASSRSQASFPKSVPIIR